MLTVRYLLLMVGLHLFYAISIQSEVQNVTIRWTSVICMDSCVRGLEQQFRRVPGVKDFSINGPAGQAEFKWDKAIPFSYRSIEAAMAMIGLGINDLRITVRGTINQDRRNVILTSLGDGTRFFLLGPPQMMRNQHVEENNPDNRPLPPQMKQQLMEAERQKKIVTITGPLFQPEASPPLYLVVSLFNVSESSDQNIK